MSNVQRRRGSARPNRGGGRHAKSGASRGGASDARDSTKAAGQNMIHDDDLVLDVMPDKEKISTLPEQEQGTRHKAYKLRMQKLSMTPENQKMVYDTLLHLDDNPGLAKKDGQPQCSSLASPMDGMENVLRSLPGSHHFRLDNKLVIEDSVSNTACGDDEPELMYQFQVKKLQKYGFDRSRCLDALVSQDGDIGGSIELLLSQCLPDFTTELETTAEEAREQREDEALALSSINEDKFTEKIPNRLWLIDLDLPQLTKLMSNKKNTAADDDRRPICAYYMKGHCKFGSRCRQKHVSKADLEAQSEQANRSLFNVEIRFPLNSLYPFEPPLIAFLSQSFLVKPDLCLKISTRLMREAAELAADGAPAIFTVLSLLDDEEELKRIIQAPLNPLSLALEKNIPQPKEKPQPFQQQKIVEPEVEDDSSDSESETAPKIKNYLKPENRLDKSDSADTAVSRALRRRQKEDALYDRPMEKLLEDNSIIRKRFKKKQSNMSYQKMVGQRKELPAWWKKTAILNSVQNNQVTVISGSTGCGKTTQVPQFILDACIEDSAADLGQIVCTQPRRISALAVAERVAQERTERLGDVVGYQIRLESQMSCYTRLLYCTTGILLRRLESDALLAGVSHVIIDEVHERSEESDFLIMILRNLCRKRADLKVILMSATLNADLFSQYFGACPVIDIPGKMYPVTRRFLEDVIQVTGYTLDERSSYARQKKSLPKMREIRELRDHELTEEVSDGGPNAVPGKVSDDLLSLKQLALRYTGYQQSTLKTLSLYDFDVNSKMNNDLIESLLSYIVRCSLGSTEFGAILIFLPGFMEINSLYDHLLNAKTFKDKTRFTIIPLHSALSSEDQQAVFKKPRPGMTKIVLATNIAETSVTIDDVVYVIDAGRMKERRYDSNRNMESLDLCWVSSANAIQREGRAGRVAPGVCYHLFTQNQFRHQFRDQPVPEIQRVPLERMILRIMILDAFKDMHDVKDVLSNLLEPPRDCAVVSALERLQDLGALNGQNKLTPLGYHLAFLPVDVRIGKLMLYGVIMRCLDPVLTIAASLSHKSPFLSPFMKRDEAEACKRGFAGDQFSDHLTLLKAYDEWLEKDKTGAGYAFCNQNYLAVKTLHMLASLKRQYVELLSDIGFVSGDICRKRMERSACRGSDGVKQHLPPEMNCNGTNMKIVSSVLCAALYPQVVQVISPETRFIQSGGGTVAKAHNAEELKFKTKRDGYVFIHPSSVNFSVRHYDSPFLVYHEKIRTSKVFLRDCSMVSPYSLILFAGGEVHIALDKDRFVLFIDDGWIRFNARNYEVANLIRKLRKQFDHLLEEKIDNPELDLATCPRGNRIIETIVTLLTTQ